MNIYVGNLSFRMEEDELAKIFEQYGTVESAKIISDKISGRSKGFGFVTMEDDEAAKKAIEELNGKTVNSRDMTVNEARPKKDKYDR